LPQNSHTSRVHNNPGGATVKPQHGVRARIARTRMWYGVVTRRSPLLRRPPCHDPLDDEPIKRGRTDAAGGIMLFPRRRFRWQRNARLE
jgi:hypothetical protein